MTATSRASLPAHPFTYTEAPSESMPSGALRRLLWLDACPASNTAPGYSRPTSMTGQHLMWQSRVVPGSFLCGPPHDSPGWVYGRQRYRTVLSQAAPHSLFDMAHSPIGACCQRSRAQHTIEDRSCIDRQQSHVADGGVSFSRASRIGPLLS